MSKQWVYFFGGGKTEGKAEMKNLLGGKGSNLAEMANLDIPVPPGFTITTERRATTPPRRVKQFISGTSNATALANTTVARCVIVIFTP